MDNPQPEHIIPEIPTPADEEPKGSPLRAIIIETLQTIVLAVLLFIVINTLTARIRVDGFSMEPTFHHNDYVIVNRLAYRLGDIDRGDVIVFPFPNNQEEDYIKRVIGLPGDRIEISNGQVFVNGEMIEEPYIKAPPMADLAELVVPAETVYVMGDNLNDSSDSRRWGPLSVDDIIGKAFFVYWPTSSFGVVTHYDLSVSGP